MKKFFKIVFLFPLTLLYGLVVRVRNKLFDFGILPEKRFNVPIISVGNITVGGTGKTPHTEYLVSLLKDMNFRVGVISRGYKRKSRGFILASNKSTAIEIGDEPFQIKKKFSDISVAVDAKRERAIQNLLAKQNNPQVFVLDDAFQYRYVQAGLSILLIDYNRLIYNDSLLPMGRLREPANERYRADILIVTKCPQNMRPIEMRIIDKNLNFAPTQQLFFSYFEYGTMYNIFDSTKRYSIESLKKHQAQILIVTGVASPEPLYQYISEKVGHYETIRFLDHHSFTKENWNRIAKKYASIKCKKKLILVTEKDAARIYSDKNVPQILKNDIYTIPLQVKFLCNSEETFKNQIFKYVKTNKRDGRFS